MKEKKRLPELLAPGGSAEGMRMAICAGADAVYMGGKVFGARAYADNPDDKNLLEAIDYCHIHGRKLYLTVNTLLKEKEISGQLYDFLEPLYRQGLDAVLVQDLGVLSFIRREFPQLALHASTQMSVMSVQGALWLKENGVSRIVPAREIDLREIKKIHDASDMEIECFIHGALCYSYSGQCLLSSLIGGRSGNRGRCAQPCRQQYALYNENGDRAGGDGRYLLSLKDICTLHLLPQLVEAGVSSLKIEGRMKRPEYAAGVTEVYRNILDHGGRPSEDDIRMLQDLYNRGGFSEGYYRIRNARDMMSMARPNHAGTAAAGLGGKAKGKAGGKAGSAAGREYRALEDLYRGDVLETDPRPGHAGTEVTMTEDVKKGGRFMLPVKAAQAGARSSGPGSVISRVRCEHLLEQIRGRNTQEQCKEKIKGMFILHHGEPAILKVRLSGMRFLEEHAVRAVFAGEVPVEALAHPLTDETARKQLLKTGNTPFVFEELETDIEEGLFLPVTALNDLRRRALILLQEIILNEYRRPGAGEGAAHSGGCAAGQAEEGVSDDKAREPLLTCLVQTRQQLDQVIQSRAVARVYADCMLWLDEKGQGEMPRTVIGKVHAAGKECFLALPVIWREDTQEIFGKIFTEPVLDLFDGFLLRHTDQIRSFSGRQGTGRLVTDAGIYVFNRGSIQVLRENKISGYTLPAELNAGELGQVSGPDAELVVYGYQQVMVTAQCLRKNTSSCTKIPSVMLLADKTGARFPVKNCCSICTNIIYNSLPLSLRGRWNQILKIHPGFIRLSFTIENAGDVRRVLSCWENHGMETSAEPDGKYTRGHFARGVE